MSILPNGEEIIFGEETVNRIVLPDGREFDEEEYVVNKSKELPACENYHLEKNFTEIEKIGEGGFGIVMKAKNIVDEHFYAIKKIKLETIANNEIYEEAKALADIKHPNVTQYYANWHQSTSSGWLENISIIPGTYFFIQMELCDMTLYDYIKEQSSINLQYNLNLFRGILQGIAYVHGRGIIHRDLKPDNIFLVSDENIIIPKIGDFGLTKKFISENESEEDIIPPKIADFESEENIIPPKIADFDLSKKFISENESEIRLYDIKDDILALGVILFDLFYLFTTDRQRVNDLKLLLDGKVQDFQKKHEFHDVVEMIGPMVNKKRSQRPTANEILDNKLMSCVTESKDHNLEQENEALKQENKALRQEIEALKQEHEQERESLRLEHELLRQEIEALKKANQNGMSSILA